jgi:hypothetical protein
MNLSRLFRAVTLFMVETMATRVASNFLGLFILLAVGLVAMGFATAYHACIRFVGMPIPVLALTACLLGSGCGTVQPCRCIVAPAPDPRVSDLVAEIDRGQAEIARLRDRIRANDAAEVDPEPVWVFPKIQPEGVHRDR